MDSPSRTGWPSFDWVTYGDLVIASFWTLLTILVALMPVVRTSPVRVIVGLSFLLFVPGYVFLAALFPEGAVNNASNKDNTEPESAEGDMNSDAVTLSLLERAVFSVVLSAVLVPSVGFVLNFTPWGIALGPLLATLGGLTLALCGIGYWRRHILSPDQRLAVVATLRSRISVVNFDSDKPVQTGLTLVTAIAILITIVSIGYTVAVPADGDPFSQVAILTENETTGELTAGNYPESLVSGESTSLVVRVDNRERQQVSYTLVVEAQRVQTDTGEQIVTNQERIDTFNFTLAAGGTWTKEHSISTTLTGDRVRLAYMLYVGDPPADPMLRNARTEAHLWITVTETESPSDSE